MTLCHAFKAQYILPVFTGLNVVATGHGNSLCFPGSVGGAYSYNRCFEPFRPRVWFHFHFSNIIIVTNL